MRRSSFYLPVFTLFLGAAAVWFYRPSLGPFPPPSLPPSAARGPEGIEGPYFSDRERIAARIIAAINATGQSLDLAIYSLTEPQIAAAIRSARRRGVRVRIVADQGQAAERHSQLPSLSREGIEVRMSGGFRGERSLMHNKFAVFDRRIVETGSFNWTISAEDFNYENAVFIADPPVVARFEDEFERIWSRAR